MKLQYYCGFKSCGKSNSMKVKSNNRFDLTNEIGEEINERCKYCGNHTKRHINRLRAEPNNTIIIGGVILAGIITALLWDFGFISTLSASIPVAIWANENKKAGTFNKVLIRN